MVNANPTGRTSAKWKAYGPDVLPLWVAEMDFPLAPVIADALHDAIDRSDTGYRWVEGLPESLAGFAQRRLNWQVDPQHVIVLGDVLAAMSESLGRLTPPASSIVITP
ncbi:MAG: pyridoxal phosphate-dependent aminotransferase, partial [Actinomycetota bacterium]